MIKNEKITNLIYLFIVAVAVFSLFFSFTNRIFLSPLICTCIIFLPYLIIKKNKIEALTKVLLASFIYFVITVIFYDVGSLFEFGFYRRDGNFFITYAPLLILSLVVFNCNTKKIMSVFLWSETIINLVCMILFLIFGQTSEYYFLFKAHNAAGGFITTILAFAVVKYLMEKDRKDLIIVIINLIALLMTDSRGSIIGLILGGVCLLIYVKTKFKNIDILLFSACLAGVLVISGAVISIIGKDVLKDDGQNYTLPTVFENTIIKDGMDLINRSLTIVNRVFYLWPRALQLWVESPIVGVGFGAYNDIPYNLNNVVPNLITFNNSENIVFSDSHAHNSYLHILAETGIIGFIMVLLLLYIFRKTILQVEDKTLRYGLYYMFLTIVFSSFTEHRLFTPSQVFPFTILFGLALCQSNYLKSGKKKRELLIVNGRFLTQKITGVQRYAKEVVKEFDKLKQEVILLAPKGIDKNSCKYNNIKVYEVGFLSGHLWEQIILPIYVMKYKLNYNVKFFNFCNTAPIILPGYVTLHDIGFKTNCEHLNKKFVLWYKFITFLNIKRYRKIFTVSEFSKKEILKNYKVNPNNIVVTYNGADHIKNVKTTSDILKKFNLENKDFYFSLGSKSPHKNHKFIEKLAIDNPDKIFVISGNENKVFKGCENTTLTNVVYTGYLYDSQIVELYKSCKAFIFPSLYEGFGIPPLEALKVGCKNVLVSDIKVFHEIFGKSVTYIDIDTKDTIDIDKIQFKNNDIEIIQKYTWKNVAEKVLKNLE